MSACLLTQVDALREKPKTSSQHTSTRASKPLAYTLHLADKQIFDPATVEKYKLEKLAELTKFTNYYNANKLRVVGCVVGITVLLLALGVMSTVLFGSKDTTTVFFIVAMSFAIIRFVQITSKLAVEDSLSTMTKWERLDLGTYLDYSDNGKYWNGMLLTPVPRSVRTTSLVLKSRLPGAVVYVDFLNKDPFLVVAYNGGEREEYFVEVWDEVRFTT